MERLIGQFIDKECVVTTIQGESLKGIMMSTQDNWMVLKNHKKIGEPTKMINMDYVISVDERRPALFRKKIIIETASEIIPETEKIIETTLVEASVTEKTIEPTTPAETSAKTKTKTKTKAKAIT